MNDLDEVANLKFDWTNQYFQAIERQIELHLERCKGQYYIMLPDLHPGSDCLAAWRGPANLCMDLLDYPEKVKSALALIMQPYFDCFEHYMEILRANNLPCACWSGMVSSRPYAIPSSDFSFMIGNEEFESLLLPGLIEECKHFPDNIFHVDGIGVLRHLDLLLEIPELNAIQWVCGAGGGRATDWLEVYRRCQSKGKAIQIFSTVAEVDTLIENLRPEGVWLRVDDVQSVDEFDAIMKKINKWT